MAGQKRSGDPQVSRAAEMLFNYPRLYRAKFAVTAAILSVVKPFLFKTMVCQEDLLRISGISSASTVCEIGCGDGENYKKITSAFGEVSFTGIDINPAMISHCRATFPRQQWMVSGLPYAFPDNSFDYCLITNVLHHLNHKDDVLFMMREAKRISKHILLLEPLQSENPALYRLKQLYWTITDGGSYYQRLGEFHTLFKSAGLRIEWESFTLPLRHFYGALLAHAD